MQATHLDWSTAEVRDGRLTVSLDVKPSKDWIQSFERAARLLNHGRFADIRVRRATVRIEPIVPGEEEVVRHFLESVAQEANAHVEAEEGESEPGNDASGEASTDQDSAMTARFRAFAPADEAAGATGGN